MGAKDHCGCCGRRITQVDLWCKDCEKHVLIDGWLHERTWHAQTGKPCPYDRNPPREPERHAAK